jgi:nucleoside 2-deoxyribosyltransferase
MPACGGSNERSDHVRKTIYLASPLGFADSTNAFMVELAAALREIVDVLNPWDDQRFASEFTALQSEDSVIARLSRLAEINRELGRANAEAIDRADGVIAILDGVDVDSGTAAEIGYAFGQGKRVYGLRTDFRLAGDNYGSIVNLQVQYFIEASGGSIVTTASDLLETTATWAAQI